MSDASLARETQPSSTTPGRRFVVRGAIFAAAILIAGVTPAVASAYWDFQGYLHPGDAYGEGQAGTSGDWWIRVSRSNCGAKTEFRLRSNGTWQQTVWPGGCSNTDYSVAYDLAAYNASHAINTSCCDVWVNVRIDATV